jgi:hypothetical protein
MAQRHGVRPQQECRTTLARSEAVTVPGVIAINCRLVDTFRA